MSQCFICKKNCSKVKTAIFDGEGDLIGYAGTECMQKYRIDNNGKHDLDFDNADQAVDYLMKKVDDKPPLRDCEKV